MSKIKNNNKIYIASQLLRQCLQLLIFDRHTCSIDNCRFIQKDPIGIAAILNPECITDKFFHCITPNYVERSRVSLVLLYFNPLSVSKFT